MHRQASTIWKLTNQGCDKALNMAETGSQHDFSADAGCVNQRGKQSPRKCSILLGGFWEFGAARSHNRCCLQMAKLTGTCRKGNTAATRKAGAMMELALTQTRGPANGCQVHASIFSSCQARCAQLPSRGRQSVFFVALFFLFPCFPRRCQ